MANLEPMPISSLPEGDIQDGDKMVIYRETTGKAYQTDAGIIEELNADLTDVAKSKNYTDFDAMLADWAQMDNYKPIMFSAASAVANVLINGAGSSRYSGVVTRTSTSNFDYIMWNNGMSIYSGRIISDGTISALYRYSGTSYLSTSSVGDPVVMGEDD